MVTRLNQYEDVIPLIKSNEEKIKAGGALIGVERFADQDLAYYSYHCRTEELAYRSRKNPKITKPFFELMVAFHPDEVERLSNKLLLDLARQYMVRLGYTESPYLVYKRTVHPHLHIHILGVRLTRLGKLVLNHFENRFLSKIRYELEQEYQLIVAAGRDDNGKKKKKGIRKSVKANGDAV